MSKKMEWRQFAYAGNTLDSRWGHSATLHDTRVVLFGGRDERGYYNSYLSIDTATQLIEMKPEEAAKEKLKRKKEETNKVREAVNNLQNAVHELQSMVTQLGEELLAQKDLLRLIVQEVSNLKAENEALTKKLQN